MSPPNKQQLTPHKTLAKIYGALSEPDLQKIQEQYDKLSDITADDKIATLCTF